MMFARIYICSEFPPLPESEFGQLCLVGRSGHPKKSLGELTAPSAPFQVYGMAQPSLLSKQVLRLLFRCF
jgi:hypothetical protein